MTTILQTTRSAMLQSLSAVAGVIAKKSTMPILQNVLITGDANGVMYTGYDLEIQVKASDNTTPLSNAPKGLTLEARKLLDVLKSLPAAANVTLDRDKNDRVILKSGKSRFTLQTLPAQDYPAIEPAKDYAPGLVLPQKTLRHLIMQVSFAMAVHDIRYYLNGILLEINTDGLRAVATDGHRMALAGAPLPDGYEAPDKPVQVILPDRAVGELKRLLLDTDAPAWVRLAAAQATIHVDGADMVTKLVEGRYPDYARVIPANHRNRVTLPRLAILGALQRVAVLTEDKFKGVRLSFAPGTLTLTATNSSAEEAVDTLDIEYAGPAVEMGFNVDYLASGLSNLACDVVTMSFGDENSSALFTTEDDPTFRYVVMPMRI